MSDELHRSVYWTRPYRIARRASDAARVWLIRQRDTEVETYAVFRKYLSLGKLRLGFIGHSFETRPPPPPTRYSLLSRCNVDYDVIEFAATLSRNEFISPARTYIISTHWIQILIELHSSPRRVLLDKACHTQCREYRQDFLPPRKKVNSCIVNRLQNESVSNIIVFDIFIF